MLIMPGPGPTFAAALSMTYRGSRQPNYIDELTTADLTAVSIYQATLAVPGRVIPNDPAIEQANLRGEALFNKIGCATCHATLSLTSNNNPGLPGQPGWIYFEPNPYNPGTGPNAPNLQLGPANYPVSAPALAVDLTSNMLPLPRLRPHNGSVFGRGLHRSQAA
jgi:mono/diheme cytochrome c family protein